MARMIVRLPAMYDQQDPGHEDLRQNCEPGREGEEDTHCLLRDGFSRFGPLSLQRARIGGHEG